MTRRILIIQGHPDPSGQHFGHALAEAYADGAERGGHEVKRIEVASLDFPLLRTQREFENEKPPVAIADSQAAIMWAEHIVMLYPLWLGTMPALFKGFIEQVFRPGFAMDSSRADRLPRKLLKGRSARIVVTMGMPAFFYRWYYRAHSLKSLERNILGFCGVAPVHDNLVGMVEQSNDVNRNRWLEKMRRLGEQGL